MRRMRCERFPEVTKSTTGLRGARTIAFAAAAAATLALTTPASASTTQPMSWGSPSNGGPVCNGTLCYASPQQVDLSGAVSLDAENTYSLATMANGTVMAWGQGRLGQLGNGSTVAHKKVPVRVKGLSCVTQTDGGNSFGIALGCHGKVHTWGYNGKGMLGDGTTVNSDVPVTVNLPGPACAVAAGGWHAEALLCDGTLWTWGAGQAGELGTGNLANHLTPVQVLSGVAAISSGNRYAYAVMKDGSLESWGDDDFGQLCDGTTTTRSSPGPAATSLTGQVAQVSAGGDTIHDGHVLFLLKDGTVDACGDGAEGQLGDGTTVSSTAPVPVEGLSSVTVVEAGGSHSMALDSSGELWAWGGNEHGQVGDASTTDTAQPVEVLSGVAAPSGSPDASSVISAGSMHSLALEGS